MGLFLKVTGERQGMIKGTSLKKGFENQILLSSWSWGVISPRDSATGLATGKRQHRPINFKANFTKASPLLAQALCTNENLSEVVLACTTSTTDETLFCRITLANAALASIDCGGSEDEVHPGEQLTMTYQKITWEAFESTTAGTKVNAIAQDDLGKY